MASPDKFFRIEISPDGMSAVSVRLETGAESPTAENLRSAIERSGVRFGLDEGALKIALMALPGSRTVIATGNPPKPGCDGAIHLKETPMKKAAPKLLADGKVDYRDMQIVKNVVKGQVIAEREPAIPGMPGMNVRRVPVDAPPVKDPELVVGANTAITPDGLKLISLIDGHLVMESSGLGRQEIRVDDTFVLKKSVDMSTGNIYCIGNCEIRGNVNEGFKVIAQGNIKILGVVEGAEIVSHGGSVEMMKGVKGQLKGAVRAAKTIKSKFIENSLVECGGDVIVDEHIMHSRVFSAAGVYIEGNPGALIGGETSFVTWLKARQIGSEANPKTNIYLGDWIARAATKRIDELMKMMTEIAIQADASQEAMNKIRQLTLEDPSKNSGEIETLGKIAMPLERLLTRAREIKEEIDELKKKIKPITNKPVIEVIGSLHAGVTFEGEEFESVTMKNDRRSLKITIGEGPNGAVGLRVRSLRG